MKLRGVFIGGLLLSAVVFSASAQKISTRGKEFYVAFFKNQELPGPPAVITTKLFITARVAVTGTVINPNTAYNVAFAVAPGTVTVVDVPLAQSYNTVAGAVNNLGLVINASDTVSVAGMNEEQNAGDAADILQSAILGTDYIAACYQAEYTAGLPQFSFPSCILIEATVNNTAVSITPSTPTSDGHAAGIAYSVTLNRGQTYLVNAALDLSGSQVSVTNGCKPIAVFSGNVLTTVPAGDCCGEHLYEQLLPVNLWGRMFITAPFKSRNSSRIRVYAAYNNTTITIDGTPVSTINRGQYFETNTGNLAKYIVTNNPVEIMEFANSRDYDIMYGPANDGDPTMMTLSPVEQQAKDILFLSPTTGAITAHFVTVICKTADVALTMLDGAGIAALFSPVPGNPVYSFAETNIAAGTHRLLNVNGCTAYAYGTGLVEGYGYNAGADVESINTYFTVNSTSIITAANINVCKGSATIFEAVSADNIISYSWDFGDGSPVITTNGTITQQSHIYITGGPHTVSLTTVKAATNPCAANNTAISSVVVNVSPDLGPDSTTVVCNTTTTDLTTFYNTAGLTFTWTNGGSPVPVPAAVLPGNYRIVAGNGTCTDTAFVVISAAAPVSPAVQIAITAGAQGSCAGTALTFTATPTNGGTSPAYQWKVNGVNAGTNSPAFTSATLANADVVTVVLTSNAGCVTANNVASNDITVTVSPPLTPAVSIAITAGSQTGCAGSSITFTATAINGGTAPAYQWKVNGNNAGTNSATFTSATLANNDVVTVVMTSNETCLAANTAVSNAITITITTPLVPSVSIAASKTAICAGTGVTFTATPINGGAAPAYQWKKNGVNAGAGLPVYIDNSLHNGDIISCTITSSQSCVTTSTANSNAIVMAVETAVTPSVMISTLNAAICNGKPATFNATAVNGGSSPVYQWQKNGINVGTGSNVYTGNNFVNGDIISCILTSNSSCVTVNPVASNTVALTVFQAPVVSLEKNNTLCSGSSRTLDAGNFKSYLWNDGSTNRSLKITSIGTYYVAVTDKNGCAGSDTVTLNTLLQAPGNFLPKDTAICSYGSITINAKPGYSDYLWNDNSTQPGLTVTKPGSYWLEVKDMNNCTGKDSILVLPKQCLEGFYVPTAFSPNNDGKNDLFKPMLFGDVKKYRFIIYNRWGQTVFQTTDVNKGWDGNYKGINQNGNAFVWICNFQFANEQEEIKKGTVVLIR